METQKPLVLQVARLKMTTGSNKLMLLLQNSLSSRKGETATEVEGNAVAYMEARIARFVKDTLFKMVKFIWDDELSQIAMGLVMDYQKIPPSGRKGFSNQYMKVLLDTRAQQGKGPMTTGNGLHCD